MTKIETKRYRLTVPADDQDVIDWMAAQASPSWSIRMLIRRYIKRYGIFDVTCLPVSPNRAGRPSGEVRAAREQAMQAMMADDEDEAAVKAPVAAQKHAGAPGGTRTPDQAQTHAERPGTGIWGQGDPNAPFADESLKAPAAGKPAVEPVRELAKPSVAAPAAEPESDDPLALLD